MSVISSHDPAVIGERLKDSRIAAGITQEAAASKIGVGRTTLVAIEKGQRQLKDLEFVNLCKLYSITPVAILNPDNSADESFVRYRKVVAQQNKSDEAQQAVDLLLSLAKGAHDLESTLGKTRHFAVTPSFPIIQRDLRVQADDAANLLRQYLGLGVSPISNIFSLLEIELGMRIFSRKLPSGISGVYLKDDIYGHCILVNSDHYLPRRVFSVAHELGHAVSVPNHVDIFDYNAKESPREERFANLFASFFLMPSNSVRKQFDHYDTEGGFSGHNLIALAKSFNVSAEAMCRRLEDLKLLKQGTYESIKARGFSPKATKLSEDDEFKMYLPYRTALLVAKAYDDGDYSEGQLLEMFKLDRIEFRKVLDAIEYEGALNE